VNLLDLLSRNFWSNTKENNCASSFRKFFIFEIMIFPVIRILFNNFLGNYNENEMQTYDYNK